MKWIYVLSILLFGFSISASEHSYVVRCLHKDCLSKGQLPKDSKQHRFYKNTHIFNSKYANFCKNKNKSRSCFKDISLIFFQTEEIKTSMPAIEPRRDFQLSCNLTDGLKSDDFFLSPGQTLTGADLIRSENKTQTTDLIHPVNVSIIDGFLNSQCISNEFNPIPTSCSERELSHGNSVSNILLAQGNGAFVLSGGKGPITYFDFMKEDAANGSASSVNNNGKLRIEMSHALQIIQQAYESKADVINLSGYIGLTRSDLTHPTAMDLLDLQNANDMIFDQFHDLAKNKTLVIAAGNNSTFPSEITNFASADMFIAGALNGPVQDQTIHADKITAYVPSGNFGWSRPFNSIAWGTGETSGAAPVLSGAIANVKALVPQISNANLKTLIKQTGIPTKFGAPVLNAYKMYRVAQEISKKCPARNQDSCLTKMVSSPTLFNYQVESETLLKRVALQIKTLSPGSCPPKELFDNALKGYLLNPTNSNRTLFESLPKYLPSLTFP